MFNANNVKIPRDLPENVTSAQYRQAVSLQRRFALPAVNLTNRGLAVAEIWADKPEDTPLPASRRSTQAADKGPKGGTLKTCGKCGGKGHNARTCGKGTDKWGRKVRGKNTCGKCGGKGHNARTCNA